MSNEPPPYPKQEYLPQGPPPMGPSPPYPMQQQPPPQQPAPMYYPPQPTGYPSPPPQHQQQQTVVIQQATAIVVAPGYGYNPIRVSCPHCQAEVVTAVEYEVGGMAWLICGIIVLVGLFIFFPVLLGCCFIPFCINDCKDAVHICPNCRQTLARVPRMK